MVTNDDCLELILYFLEVLCGTLHYTGGHRLEFYKSAQWLVFILENYVGNLDLSSRLYFRIASCVHVAFNSVRERNKLHL